MRLTLQSFWIPACGKNDAKLSQLDNQEWTLSSPRPGLRRDDEVNQVFPQGENRSPAAPGMASKKTSLQPNALSHRGCGVI